MPSSTLPISADLPEVADPTELAPAGTSAGNPSVPTEPSASPPRGDGSPSSAPWGDNQDEDTSATTPRTLLVVNLGTTDTPTPEGVRAFLREFLGDPFVVDWPRWLWKPVLHGVVLRIRPPRVARLYASIWDADEGAPLRAGTERIVRAMQAEAPPEVTVRAVYRYGSPGLETELRAALRKGPVQVVSLFPHQTASTTGTLDALVARVSAEAGSRRGLEAPGAGSGTSVPMVHLEPDDPGFIDALVARWEATVSAVAADERPEHLVFSYHGIPLRHDRRESRRYSEGCARTTAAFLARTGWPSDRATTTFQSKFGPEKWLEPATDATLERLAREGVRRLGVLTPGFLTEGLETLEEIGEEARETFLEAGGTHFHLVPCVEAHPSLVHRLLAAGGVPGRRPSPTPARTP